MTTETKNGWREVAPCIKSNWFVDFFNIEKDSFSFHLGWTIYPTVLEPYLFERKVFNFFNHFVIRFIDVDKKEPQKLSTPPFSWSPELPDLFYSKICHELPTLCHFLCFVSILVLEQELSSLWKMINIVMLFAHFCSISRDFFPLSLFFLYTSFSSSWEGLLTVKGDPSI